MTPTNAHALDAFGRMNNHLWFDCGASANAVRIKHGYGTFTSQTTAKQPLPHAFQNPLISPPFSLFSLCHLIYGSASAEPCAMDSDSTPSTLPINCISSQTFWRPASVSFARPFSSHFPLEWGMVKNAFDRTLRVTKSLTREAPGIGGLSRIGISSKYTDWRFRRLHGLGGHHLRIPQSSVIGILLLKHFFTHHIRGDHPVSKVPQMNPAFNKPTGHFAQDRGGRPRLFVPARPPM